MTFQIELRDSSQQLTKCHRKMIICRSDKSGTSAVARNVQQTLLHSCSRTAFAQSIPESGDAEKSCTLP